MTEIGQPRRRKGAGALLILAACVAAPAAAFALQGGVVAAQAQYGSQPATPPTSSGRIVFQSNRADGNTDIYVMNADATGVRRLTFDPAIDRHPSWSPDGTRIAFVSNRDGGNNEVYVMNGDGSGVTRVTDDPAVDFVPAWTADGRVVWQRARLSGPTEIWIANADGSAARALDLGPGSESLPAPAPRGDLLAFTSDRGDGVSRIYTAFLDGRALKTVTDPPPGVFGDFRPRWSPNGNDLVFMRDTTGVENDVYTVHADGSGLRAVVATPNRFEEQASFSPDGERILFGVFPFPGLDPSTGPPRLHTVRVDGSDERRLPLQVAPLVDDFGDGVRDSSLWHEAVSGTHAAVAETSGRVEVTIGADAEPGGQYNAIDAHYGSQCSLPGDYDLQVDYALLAWPPVNGVQVALDAFFQNAFAIRESKPWGERYFAWIDPTGDGYPTTDASGRLRLVRSDGVVSAYARNGAVWNLIHRGPSPGTAVYGFGASAFADGTWSHQEVRVAFDDFVLHAGELSCPNWWSSVYGDWAKGPAAAESPRSAETGELVFNSNRADGNQEIYRLRADGTGLQRLTFHHARDRDARWSPDGSQIAFRSNRAGAGTADDELWLMNADGSGQRQLTFNDVNDGFPSWTEDGRIVFSRGFAAHCCDQSDLWLLDPATGAETQLTSGPASDHLPDAAPRGTKVAFGSDRAGDTDLWILNREDGSLKRITSGPGFDFTPVWSPQGNELFFLRDVTGLDNDIYAVRASGGGLRRITDTPLRVESYPTVSPDGERIAFAASDGHIWVANADGSGEARLTSIGANSLPDWRPEPATEGAVNLARGKPVTASLSLQSPPERAVDGRELLPPWESPEWWGAGAFAPQWIEIDLGTPSTVARLRFVVEQSPPGFTVHDVYGRASAADPWRLLHTFAGFTQATDVLDHTAPAPWADVRHVRVETVSSPSWVAWRELEVISPG